ncbi:MAG: hypothetical protein GY749_30420 [Desulfobacteraceae bacterium]|nr:hypothetical protein [Desulfobacteraceae bacterium]
MKKCFRQSFLIIILIMLFSSVAFGGSKVLYVDSYHEGYPWSDGITKAIQSVFKGKDVELRIFRMDTKRNTDKRFIRKAAIEAKAEIEKFKPDLVIASDDNASKYLIEPFYKNADLPVVFCGINWDASMYGYPYKNATGMVEVSSVHELLKYLKPVAKGGKIAYLAADVTTARKEGLYYRKLYKLELTEKYVKEFTEWVSVYADIQKECDILIVGNKAGINNWNESEAEKAVLAKTKVPTGTLYEFMSKYALAGYAKIPEEQGEWAAETALKILNGTDISSIPLTENKKGRVIINRKIEKSLGITFSDDVISSAETIIE